MKALVFEYNIPKYLLTGALARRWPQVLTTGLAPAGVREIEDPRLPGPEWVKVRPRLSGFCGSDLSIVLCRESLTLAPFSSFPFVIGHEVCGEIAEVGEAVEGFEPGDRVTVMPVLGCRQRGIDPPCPMCARGRYQLCENFTEGSLPAGMLEGNTAEVHGYISEMGLAHVSQIYKVPAGVSDENAVLTEPFATTLHMVLANRPQPGETVLVFGCGVMGLCTIAALRALCADVKVLAAEVDPFHSQVAREMGAEEVLRPGGKDFYRRVAELTGAKMHTPLLVKPLLVGGVDRVFDAVGNTETVHTSLRILKSGGWYNMLGIGEPKHIDWTPVWLKELTLRGIYAYQEEEWEGERVHTFALALRLFEEGKVDLSRLVTHRFRLEDYPRALEVALNKGKHQAIKVVFTP
ncbi:alcohol dehydrogenase catalytic domain-containing protein [Candidatus Solincola tengchongensis]|uniref:zinc-dependent alcohol dehydrogenase n=1 Tax=Candidatus Solincola tengchongensis TaxID=2900693 RepID=UPI00257C7409|nr:alcohol dehydrogenase catalytic domain-containing protein [Candidatus Solincola tengchongensis]